MLSSTGLIFSQVFSPTAALIFGGIHVSFQSNSRATLLGVSASQLSESIEVAFHEKFRGYR